MSSPWKLCRGRTGGDSTNNESTVDYGYYFDSDIEYDEDEKVTRPKPVHDLGLNRSL